MISCSLTKKISSSRKRIIPPNVEYDKNLDTALTCYVYQYAGLDSIDKSISKIIKYDSKNRILSEKYQGFKKSSYEATANVIDYFDYKNELLVQKRTVYIDNSTPSFQQLDSAKIIFYYDSQNELIKRQHYDFKRRFKPNVDKGIGRSSGCIADKEDYEKESTWDITSEIFFKYDSLGRKIEYYAPKTHWGNQNRYTWSYCDNGKINEYSSYDHDRLIWIERFSYTDTSYQFIRTWYDYKGNPEHLKKKSWEYTPQITLVSKLDNQGRVIEEIKENEKTEFLNSTITEYNTLGYVAKKVRYNKNKQPEITHIYEYNQ